MGRSEDNLRKSGLSSYNVDPRDWTPALSLGSKRLSSPTESSHQPYTWIITFFYKYNFLSLKLGNKSWRNGGVVRLGVQHVRGSGFNQPSDKEWIARWRPSLLLPLYFLQNLKSLYKHSGALRMSKWPVEHCKWKTENICKTIGISFLEKAVSYRNRSAIFFAFILFYFKNKPNRGTIEEKTRCALPALICMRNVCLWGNELRDKRAIDCDDCSPFCPLKKSKGWTQYQMFY